MSKKLSFKARAGLMAFVALLGAAGLFAWASYWNGFDFYRPSKVLQCAEPPKGSKPLRFIAFGDYGEGTPFQRELGAQMAKAYRKTPFEIALLLGDNIYPNGDIKRLADTHFEEPYRDLIHNNVRFLAIIGDHDDRKGHLKDLLAYFKMPNKYYQVTYGPVDFFMLNTTFFVRSPEQRAWIEQALKNSKAPWKIVVAHHPLYSSGRNGNTEGLREVLEPMLIKYKADLYLAGHDHDYERFKPTHGVDYIVSGGGGSYLYDFKEIQPNSLVRIKTLHFLLFEVTPEQLWMKAINRYGEVVDCTHWQKGQKAG